ncbi:MAG: DUF4129 domain-containing protein [Chloroflexi bacterium]|nr:DUF4129 domain-containing protein [Chloroflexota bacterium]
MTRVIALILVVLACSALEGLWVWLLATTLSEVDGQIAPSLLFLLALPFSSWLTSRLLATSKISAAVRRSALVWGGLGLAVLAATVHAGLQVPVQFVLGQRDPDYRGSATALGILVGYLWARGLFLSAQVNRGQVMSHISISVFLLANILLLLPLTNSVQEFGLEVVGASFFSALVALLLVQLADTESHQVRKAHWFGLAAAAAVAMLLVTAVFTGVLSSGIPQDVGRALGQAGSIATPVTNGILLGIGYLAEYVTYFFLWLRYLFTGDPDVVERSQREAEAARPRFNTDGPYGVPEIMTLAAAAFIIALLILFAAHVMSRLVERGERRALDSIRERRRSTRGLAAEGVRSALGWLPGFGPADGLAGRAAEIRRHYRAFQALMARASFPRAAAETASEFQASVTRSLPATRPAVATITGAYTLARYADSSTPLPDPSTVAEAVAEVRTTLQAHAAAASHRDNSA